MKLATLALEDGTVIDGHAFSAETDKVFELVFNTSMTGYRIAGLNTLQSLT